MTHSDAAPHAYAGLNPDSVLDALESVGFICDGTLLALNSYENRVYQVGLEQTQDSPIIVKFYRPGRWSKDAILEEHQFTLELVDNDIPVVPPLSVAGETILQFKDFYFAVFKRQGGRSPDLEQTNHLEWLGRLLGRLHRVGATASYEHRLSLSVHSYGELSYQYLMAGDFIPSYMESAYRTLVEDLLSQLNNIYSQLGSIKTIRLHGDCHPGNLLWTDQGPHFVDMDDSCLGPAIQDLWMLLSGDRADMETQLSSVLAGYYEFADFDLSELYLIEALRTLRMMRYAAWIAQRWHDPAFPQAFPWFNTPRYWEEHVLSLREQAALLDEPVLRVQL